MAQVIIFENENGGVSVCYPTGEISVEEVKAKDTPEHSIIVDTSELPENHDFIDAWELVNGKVMVNEDKKTMIMLEREAPIVAKQSALSKLMALGLTEEEALALGVK